MIFKSISFLILSSLVFLGTQDQTWSRADKQAFVESCIVEFEKNGDPSISRQYCYCAMEKMIELSPNPNEVDQVNSSQIENMAQECLWYVDIWPEAERKAFMDNCVAEAKGGLGEEGARNYCGCMLYKVSKRYPNVEDSANMTEDEIMSLARSCVN